MMLATAMTALLTMAAAPIQGQYIEARTADIYTGPCFSNAEIFIVGDQAVLAWKIDKGEFQGVELDGLTVAAAVKGNTTFSQDNPNRAQAIVMVDKNASPKQKEALVAFAKHMAGARLNSIKEVRSVSIVFTMEANPSEKESTAGSHEHSASAEHSAPVASFWVPGLSEILVRPIGVNDHFCGNEAVAYDPLSRDVKVLPAFTVTHHFKNKSLGGSWSVPNNRGSFVGTFSTTK